MYDSGRRGQDIYAGEANRASDEHRRAEEAVRSDQARAAQRRRRSIRELLGRLRKR
jgi:hypothetical protein